MCVTVAPGPISRDTNLSCEEVVSKTCNSDSAPAAFSRLPDRNLLPFTEHVLTATSQPHAENSNINLHTAEAAIMSDNQCLDHNKEVPSQPEQSPLPAFSRKACLETIYYLLAMASAYQDTAEQNLHARHYYHCGYLRMIMFLDPVGSDSRYQQWCENEEQYQLDPLMESIEAQRAIFGGLEFAELTSYLVQEAVQALEKYMWS